MRHAFFGLIFAAFLLVYTNQSWGADSQSSVVFRDQTPLTRLDAVTVTATKTKKPAFDVPAAISVIGEEDIARAQATKMDDVLRTLPNVDSAGGPRRISEEPSIRGLSDRRIVIKVDGMRRNFRAQYGGRYFIDPSLVQRIEVSRGGNSTLDGSGAVGGSIQIFTKDASDLLLPGQSMGYQISGGVDIPSPEFNTGLATYGKSDQFDWVAAVKYRNSDDLVAGHGRDIPFSSSIENNYFVKGSWDAGSGSKLSLTASAFQDNSRLPSSPFQPVSPANFPTHRDTEQKDVSVRYNYAAPNNDLINLNAVIYHSQTDIETKRYLDGRLDITEAHTNGLDLYNTSNFAFGDSAQNALTYGFEIYGDSQSGSRNGGFRPLLGNADSLTFGLYAQDEIKFGNRFTLIPGIRFDRWIIDPNDPAIAGQTNDSISPKLAADYKFNDTASMYASIAKSFRSPTITELYATGLLFPGNNLISNPNLQPETAINKEIGLRFKGKNSFVANDNYRIRIAAFQNDIEDYIEQVIGPATTQFRNASDAQLRGVELEASYENPGYLFSLAAGYVRGENETLNQPLVDVPPAKASFMLVRKVNDWDIDFGWKTEMAAAQNRIPAGQPLITRTGGWAVHHVFLDWQPTDPQYNNMRIDFGIDNLFDNYYRRQLAFVPDEGRTVKLNVRWKF